MRAGRARLRWRRDAGASELCAKTRTANTKLRWLREMHGEHSGPTVVRRCTESRKERRLRAALHGEHEERRLRAALHGEQEGTTVARGAARRCTARLQMAVYKPRSGGRQVQNSCEFV
jgi:hypothetical protein